jgi:hypothetical protein
MMVCRPAWSARRGSLCHSSSVTKGMKGCSRRRPESRHSHSVSRVCRLACRIPEPGAGGRVGGVAGARVAAGARSRVLGRAWDQGKPSAR